MTAVLVTEARTETAPEVEPAPTRRMRRAANRPDSRHRISVFITVAAAVCFALSLPTIDASRAGDAGLITVVGPLYVAGLALIAIAFAVALSSRRLSPVLLGTQLALLLVFLHGLPALVEANPRFFSAYLHAGFVDYIDRHGAVDQLLDARMSWPGGFALAALIQRVGGISSSLWFVRWFPVLITAAYLVPAALLCRTIGATVRARWVTLFAVIGFNWVGQDYFSPQALALLLYLTVVAMVLTAFPGPGWDPERSRFRRLRRFAVESVAPAPPTRVRLTAWFAVVTVILAIAVTHQLTPMLLPLVLGVLVITGRLKTRTLPLIAFVAAIAWLSYGASPFWKGHLDLIFGGFGNLGGNLSAGLTKRAASPSFERQLMLDVRMAMAGVLLLGAAAGFVRRHRAGVNNVAMAVLTAVPFAVVAGQSYGGESLLRATFFTLVPAACLLGVAVFPEVAMPGSPERSLSRREARTSRPRVVKLAVIGLVGAAVLVACLTARFGNERFEQVRPDERAALKWVYAHAKRGDTLLAASRNLPWRYRDLETLQYAPAGDEVFSNPRELVGAATSPSYGYFVVSRAQQDFGTAIYGLRPGWLDRVERNIAGSPSFELVFNRPDARVYRFHIAPHPEGTRG